MIVKTLKRVKTNFDEVYSRYHNTQGVNILGLIADEMGAPEFEINIDTQQAGNKLKQPHISIRVNNISYSMDMENFIKTISSEQYEKLKRWWQ